MAVLVLRTAPSTQNKCSVKFLLREQSCKDNSFEYQFWVSPTHSEANKKHSTVGLYRCQKNNQKIINRVLILLWTLCYVLCYECYYFLHIKERQREQREKEFLVLFLPIALSLSFNILAKIRSCKNALIILCSSFKNISLDFINSVLFHRTLITRAKEIIIHFAQKCKMDHKENVLKPYVRNLSGILILQILVHKID